MKVSECLYCGGANLVKVTHRIDGVGILQCKKCHVMMVNEISDNISSIYTKEYFERDTDSKYGYSTYISSPPADIVGKYGFARLFSTGLKHLDLGSADGSLMEIFEQDKFITRGLEISSDAVSVSREKGLSAEVSNLHKFPNDINNIDVITAYDLLEHADRPGLVLKNVYHSLAKDGVFVFSTLSVKKIDPSDFWFNHSLEHYIYYDHESLSGILDDVFGPGNHGFIEVEINGVYEFWGFAAKGSGVSRGLKALDGIRHDKIPSGPEQAYYLSLFYNQISEFSRSASVIRQFKEKWTVGVYAEALFYNNYVQGGVEKALKLTDNLKNVIPSSRGVFWRGYYQAEKTYSDAMIEQLKTSNNKDIITLREEVFRLTQELHHLRDSRVVGRIIKLRDLLVGDMYPRVKSSPRWAIGKLKKLVGLFLPMKTKKAIGQYKRTVRAKIKDINTTKPREVIVNNEITDPDGFLVSVVIPYYNRADTIDETLNSLVTQSFNAFEVIIVDDGSTHDESVLRLKTIADDYDTLNLRVIHQKNGGVAKARNRGIEDSKGKYIICLDSDDCLTETYIEKCLIALEVDPSSSIVTTYRADFGVRNEIYEPPDYNALKLIKDNMVTTAAMFRKTAWRKTQGYKSDIGYEDWEYWLTLAENGDWGRTLREPLFKYRVAMQSRFSDDKSAHWANLKAIRKLHPNYKTKVKAQSRKKKIEKQIISKETAFLNLMDVNNYKSTTNKPSIIIAIPWMTFGGAETLIYNFCQGLKDQYDISFVTGLPSAHEWEYKFREISDKIYHLPELLLSRSDLYTDFISNYISIHNVKVLHVIHCGYMFDMLPEIKKAHPTLSVAVTMFNDRVPEYVEKSIKYKGYIDSFNTDSVEVGRSFSEKMRGKDVEVIPNGIDCLNKFNPERYNRGEIRKELGLKEELAIFFIGRLSEEKNPDVFIKSMDIVTRSLDVKAFIIGDGPMRQDCESLIDDFKNDSIVYLGYKDDVARHLAAADIFVLPSSIEGFPLSILEAMSMGVAVIASRVGAVPDIIVDGENGHVIEPGSIDDIKDSVADIVENNRLKPIRENNIKKVRKYYSQQQVASRYNELYRGLLK